MHREAQFVDGSGCRSAFGRVLLPGWIEDFQFSAAGYFALTLTNALGHETKVHTDPAHGVPVSQWDINDLVTSTVYDAFGRLSETTPPGEPTAHQRFFWCGGATSCPASAAFVVKSYRAGAPETHNYLDRLGRQVQRSVRNFADTGFIDTTTSYDERGNPAFESQPFDLSAGESALNGMRYLHYDALNRLTSREQDQANGTVLATSYQYQDLTTFITAGALPAMSRTYDGLGQLVETQDAEGGFARYAYDGAGNPIVLQDPNGHSITSAFNAFGHKLWVDDPNMGVRQFTSNALGEVLDELDANGDTVSMDYDVLGRLIERRVNGALVGSWHYDNPAADKGLGLLDYEDSHAGIDGHGLQKHYHYSAVASGRKDLTQVVHRFYVNTPGNATDYTVDYYSDSYYARPKGLRYPGGVGVAFAYNAGGYRTQEQDASSSYVIREITAQDSYQQLRQASLGNYALAQSNSYYAATGQLQSIAVSGPSGPVQELDYEYDGYGNLNYRQATIDGETASEGLFYDDLQRLTQSSRAFPGGTAVVDYAYDAAGNLLSKSDYALSYDYAGGGPNAVSAIQKPGGASVVFGYDANGNRTQGDGTSIGYNAFNRPTTITANGVTTTFHYGAGLSRFRQQKDSGETIRYIDTLMEVVTVGSSSDYRHYLGDTALLTKTGDLDDPYPALRYTLRDRLGSVVTLWQDSGLATERRGFGSFGTPRNGDGSDRLPPLLGSALTARGFTGHEHLDDSELIHMNGRLYDYRLGQFMSVDPLIQDPGNAQSLNPYAYIMNNPLGGTDPTGYRSEKVTGSNLRDNRVPVGSRHTSVIFQQPLRENASVAGLPLRQGIDRLFNNGHAAQSIGRLGEPGGPNGGDGAGDSVDEVGATASIVEAGSDYAISSGDRFTENHLLHQQIEGDELFSPLLPSFHHYDVLTPVCRGSDGWCDKSSFDPIFRLYTFPNVGLQPHEPALDGRPVVAYVAGLLSNKNDPGNYDLPAGRVVQTSLSSGAVQNTTLRDHYLYPGKITRNTIWLNGDLYILTHGIGLNRFLGEQTFVQRLLNRNIFGRANDRFGPSAFRALDLQAIRHFKSLAYSD